MKNKLPIIIISVFIGFLLGGCNNSNTNESIDENSEKNLIPNKLCFQNEYSFPDNPSLKDIQELTLSIEGDMVSGTYNWLPAQKDQRKGSLKGSIKDNRITAQYSFSQEGAESTAAITIILKDEKAEISGGEPQLGLNATIAKIDCN